jgi:hypothetical protein
MAAVRSGGYRGRPIRLRSRRECDLGPAVCSAGLFSCGLIGLAGGVAPGCSPPISPRKRGPRSWGLELGFAGGALIVGRWLVLHLVPLVRWPVPGPPLPRGKRRGAGEAERGGGSGVKARRRRTGERGGRGERERAEAWEERGEADWVDAPLFPISPRKRGPRSWGLELGFAGGALIVGRWLVLHLVPLVRWPIPGPPLPRGKRRGAGKRSGRGKRSGDDSGGV